MLLEVYQQKRHHIGVYRGRLEKGKDKWRLPPCLGRCFGFRVSGFHSDCSGAAGAMRRGAKGG